MCTITPGARGEGCVAEVTRITDTAKRSGYRPGGSMLIIWGNLWLPDLNAESVEMLVVRPNLEAQTLGEDGGHRIEQ